MDWFARNLTHYRWNAAFYDSDGTPLPLGEYLTDDGEICVVARSSAA
jgi:hypothetical protein